VAVRAGYKNQDCKGSCGPTRNFDRHKNIQKCEGCLYRKEEEIRKKAVRGSWIIEGTSSEENFTISQDRGNTALRWWSLS